MTIHFIGAGPGAADLLTVRAVALLKAAAAPAVSGSASTELPSTV